MFKNIFKKGIILSIVILTITIGFNINSYQNIPTIDMAGVYTQEDLRFEIIGDLKQTDDNIIEFYARAWRDGKQLGFSKDGSVEIERFRIVDADITVEDPNIREFIIEEFLPDVIDIAGLENNNLVLGKIGNTTTTIYSSSGDGFYGKWQMDHVWADVIAGSVGVDINDTNDAQQIAVRTNANTTTDHYTRHYRGGLPYDTSSLTGQLVTSATLSVYGVLVQSGFNPSYSIYTGTGLSYTGLGGTESATDTDIAHGSFSTVSYNDYTLNSTGYGHINVDGTTVFGLRSTFDGTATPPTWSSGVNSELQIYYSEETGTTKDPKLVVIHEEAPATDDSGATMIIGDFVRAITKKANAYVK